MAQRQPPQDERGLYRDLRSVTNRQWGQPPNDEGFGYAGQGGYGDFDRDVQQPATGRAREGRDEAAPRRGYRGLGPQVRRGDADIQDDLHVRLTRDPRIDARDLTVVVTDGVVTLSGTVTRRGMKHYAEDLAVACSGVRDVDNRIRVSRGEESFGPPGQAVRSGTDQQGSGFSSSERTEFSERAIGSTPAEGVEDVPRPPKR